MIGLVADIGGTHARFALCEGTRGKRPCLSGIAVLACADYPSLADALSAYLAPLPAALRPRQAALAIAGPVSGDRIVVTNHPWSFSLADTRTALGLETLSALNDCTAVSRALPFLAPADVAPLGDFDADPRRVDAQRMGIVAPGTGLGIGGLLRNGTAASRPAIKRRWRLRASSPAGLGTSPTNGCCRGRGCATSTKRFAFCADIRSKP